MYLTYTEYQALGGTLDETAFNDLEYEASTYIDWVTFNRLHGETLIPESVKRCVYHIIKLLYNKMVASCLPSEDGQSADGVNASIASQSNDGVSVSFNTVSAKDVIDSSKKEIQDVIKRYLQGVTNSLGRKLLYRGLYPDE